MPHEEEEKVAERFLVLVKSSVLYSRFTKSDQSNMDIKHTYTI